MKIENSVLMKEARESLKGKWGLAIGTFLVYSLVIGCLEVPVRLYGYEHFSFSMSLVALILGGPFALGLANFSISLSRNREARFEQLFSGFSHFGVAFLAYLLTGMYVILWSLLLIVPGIIAAISYSQTFFIIADDNSIHASEAIDKSKKMMHGYKLKYFYLCLRFLGLALLCIFTLGVGFLWLFPYIYITCAKFYDDIKEQAADPSTPDRPILD